MKSRATKASKPLTKPAAKATPPTVTLADVEAWLTHGKLFSARRRSMPMCSASLGWRGIGHWPKLLGRACLRWRQARRKIIPTSNFASLR